MRYMEYKEFEIPDEVKTRLEKLAEIGQATYGAAGLFDWLTKLSQEEGWRVAWPTFNFPYVVLEREVVVEEVEN